MFVLQYICSTSKLFMSATPLEQVPLMAVFTINSACKSNMLVKLLNHNIYLGTVMKTVNS